MGLQEFDIAPDNKGGRKEQEKEMVIPTRKVSGRPLTHEGRTEDWWKATMKQCLGSKRIPQSNMDEMMTHVAELASFTHSQTITVLTELESLGIVSFEWEDYREWLPEELHDDRIPGVNRFPENTPMFGTTSKIDPDSSFASIIEDAK